MSSKLPFYFFVCLIALAYYANCRRQERNEAGMLDVKEHKTKNLEVGFQSRTQPLPETNLTILNDKHGPDAVILLGNVQVPQKTVLFPTETTRIYPELDFGHRNKYDLYDTTKL
jgi:hypothetical protein